MWHHRAADASDLERATLNLMLYSARLSAFVEQVVGAGSSGNHEMQLLIILFDRGACRPGDLAAATGLSRSGVARLVDALVCADLLERRRGTADRRTMLTSLTRAGRLRLTELEDALEQHFRATAPAAEEIVSLLGVTSPERRMASRSESALAVARRMGVAGATLTAALAATGVVDGSRSRLVLAALSVGGTARPHQLGELLDVTSGGLTAVIDRLESEGLVDRSYGQLRDDRRGVVIRLTDLGRAQVTSMGAVLARHAVLVTDVLLDALAAREAQFRRSHD